MRTRIGTWLIASLVALLLASCMGGATSGGGEGTSELSFTDVTDVQGSVVEFVGALEDAQIERCEATSDGWVSSGTVTNPGTSPQAYRLYVAFNKNRDTISLVQVDLSAVAPGSTESWQVEAPIHGDDLACVLRVERFDPRN